MNNRRNFYRILHVQPEAPLEIIKASYRSLMTKLKAHPDLGGDHETAILINHAYGILSDPKKRRQYDESLLSRKGPTRGHSAHTAPIYTYENTKQRRQGAYRSNFEDKQQSTAVKKRCLFCGTDTINTQKTNNTCSHCQSPLDRAQSIPNDRLREIFGRRSAPRIAKIGALIIYPHWPHAGFSARLRDLSPSGISLLTHYGARAGQILKFDSSNLKGVAHVVSVRSNGSHFSVHASFLAAEFVSKAGTFVAEKV
jgi:curved DNA-binding protein CbpA